MINSSMPSLVFVYNHSKKWELSMIVWRKQPELCKVSGITLSKRSRKYHRLKLCLKNWVVYKNLKKFLYLPCNKCRLHPRWVTYSSIQILDCMRNAWLSLWQWHVGIKHKNGLGKHSSRHIRANVFSISTLILFWNLSDRVVTYCQLKRDCVIS